jgi:hypothetical protein
MKALLTIWAVVAVLGIATAVYGQHVLNSVKAVDDTVVYQQDVGYSNGTPMFPNYQLQTARSVQP